MPYKDPAQQKQAQRDHHLRNKEARRDTKLARKREKMARVNEYKLAMGCSRCGYDRCAAALEPHHLGDKTANVSALCRRGMVWATILAELEKCEIVCANCHREEHWLTANSAA